MLELVVVADAPVPTVNVVAVGEVEQLGTVNATNALSPPETVYAERYYPVMLETSKTENSTDDLTPTSRNNVKNEPSRRQSIL